MAGWELSCRAPTGAGWLWVALPIAIAALMVSPLPSLAPARAEPATPASPASTTTSIAGSAPESDAVSAAAPETPGGPAACPAAGCAAPRISGPVLYPSASPPSWENFTSTSSATPPASAGAVLAFDGGTGAGYDVLFGGETDFGFLNDTWVYADDSWTNVSTTACAVTCPPPTAYGSMQYDPALGGDLLVGGLTSCTGGGCGESVSGSMYLFSGGSWSSVAASAPYGLDEASMAWDSVNDCMLLFGGASAYGPQGSTYCYDAGTATWTSYSGPAPSAREGASMVNGSLGFDVLFGGATPTSALNDTWVFYDGDWSPVVLGAGGSPPARSDAILAEDPAAVVPGTPQSGYVVLFGGEGTSGTLDDTWVLNASAPATPGATAFGNWTEDTSAPAPPPLYGAAATLDFNATHIVLVGGASDEIPGGLPLTWGYFSLAAQVSVSVSELDAGRPLVVSTLAGGGSAPYYYQYSGLPGGCVGSDVPTIDCAPSQHGHFNVSVSVTDSLGRTTSSTVALIVDPAGAILVAHSEYAGVFYTGFTIDNTFGVVTTIPGYTARSVTGTLGSLPLVFSQMGPTTWNVTINMATVVPGADLEVVANFTNWSLYGSLAVTMAISPAWMQSFFDFPGAAIVTTPDTTNGTWNDSYAVSDEMGWSLGTLLSFALPFSGFSGAYSLIPGTDFFFDFASNGSLSLSGALSSKPDISIGPIDISAEIPGVVISASVDVTGSFALVPTGPGVDTVDWISASATLRLDGMFETSIPIVGIGTPEGDLGLSLVLAISPSVALTLVLGPSNTSGGFLPGLDLVIQNLLVDLGIEFEVSLEAGIEDFLEIGGGGSVSLQTLFQTDTPHFVGLWLNASVFAFIQFLCFKITWTFWSGTIYQYPDPPAGSDASAQPETTWTWTLAPRYYNTSSYDDLVWTSSETEGIGIDDVYPATTVAAAGGSSGVALLYGTDDVAEPETSALGLAGADLGGPGTVLAPAPAPSVAGSDSFHPSLVDLPDGTIVAAFSSVAASQLAQSGPTGIGAFALETSSELPGTGWTPAVELQNWGFPLSYVLAPCGSGADLAVLDSPSPSPTATTPEYLLVYNATSGALAENASLTGAGGITGYDCSNGVASLLSTNGGASLLLVKLDAPLEPTVTMPAGWNLTDATPVVDAPGDSLLLYRSASAAEAIVYVPESGTTLLTLDLPQNSSAVAGVFAEGAYYVFVEEPGGIRTFIASATGATVDGAAIPVANLTDFGIAVGGGMILVWALGDVGGNATAPIVDLSLAEIALPAAAVPIHSPPCGVCLSSTDIVEIALAGLLLVLALAVVVLARGGRRPPAGSDPAPTGVGPASGTPGGPPPPPKEGPPGGAAPEPTDPSPD
jgi:hypothetical protein